MEVGEPQKGVFGPIWARFQPGLGLFTGKSGLKKPPEGLKMAEFGVKGVEYSTTRNLIREMVFEIWDMKTLGFVAFGGGFGADLDLI